MNLCSRTAAGIAGALATLVSFVTYAQSYPARPIELVVHTSAGSGTDVVARALADVVRRENLLPQPFVVANRVGGAGVLAYTYFRTKRGDPYSMLTIMETALERAHKTTAWKEHAARNFYLDVYMGSAEFSRFLAKRLAEARDFYNDIGLGAKP